MEGESPSRADVLALYAQAMAEAQRLEQAMVGLLGVRAELNAAAREDWEDFERAQLSWEHLFTLNAGKLRQRLALDGELREELERAVRARNNLAHHYLRDRERELDQPADRERMRASLSESVDRFQALANRLDEERLDAMAEQGLTDDHVTTPAEARDLRYWDPTTDRIVPPEPWDAS